MSDVIIGGLAVLAGLICYALTLAVPSLRKARRASISSVTRKMLHMPIVNPDLVKVLDEESEVGQ